MVGRVMNSPELALPIARPAASGKRGPFAASAKDDRSGARFANGVRPRMDARQLKIEAARAALAHVGDGVRLGIGTGSTAEEFVRLLAERVRDGLACVGVPTSERTAALCRELGVPLAALDEMPELDLTVDGADEIDPALSLIK